MSDPDLSIGSPEDRGHRAELDAKRYQRALMWVFDRLTIDGLMTTKEYAATVKEIGLVLQDRPCAAANYMPNEWDDSVKVVKPVAKPVVSQFEN